MGVKRLKDEAYNMRSAQPIIDTRRSSLSLPKPYISCVSHVLALVLARNRMATQRKYQAEGIFAFHDHL
jgi:hypothetical protein